MSDTRPWYLVENAASIATPALLLYPEQLERNIRRAIEIAGSPSRLWPHVKTHKCARIVERMRGSGIDHFKCATVAEAEMLARCGASEVLLAYPLVGENARRFARLCRAYPATRWSAIADSPEGARSLSAALVGAGVEAAVALDVDVGMHRTGVSWDRAAELYRLLRGLPGIRPGGLHCYDGHNREREPAARSAAAAAIVDDARRLRKTLEGEGLPVPLLVMGGTPSFPCYAPYPEVALSPGTCFLHDWGYQHSFPDLPFEPAALVLSRVVSRPRSGRVTVDCGNKGIAADPSGERGLPLDLRDARTAIQSEEHWTFESPDADGRAIGSEVYVLPTHICPTFALYREAIAVDAGGHCGESWPVTARDRSIGI
jgi:D-serine deaminase-like pyridoxal phosphate-dependent protein